MVKYGSTSDKTFGKTAQSEIMLPAEVYQKYNQRFQKVYDHGWFNWDVKINTVFTIQKDNYDSFKT